MSELTAYHSWSDTELADAYRRGGDQQLLAELYGRYADLLYGVCLQYLKDADAAADALSDIYLELVDKMRRHEVAYPRAWMYTLARNHCLMKLRSAKHMPTDTLDDSFMQSPEASHPEDATDREWQLSTLELCMETLKQEQREAVRLFYLEQKCYNEIAELTGLPWNTVRSHIQNGRRNLKICMDKHERIASS